MANDRKLYLALPVLNEFKNLSKLIQSIRLQEYTGFHLVVCVNHYEDFRIQIEMCGVVEDNEKSLLFFNNLTEMEVTVIDRASAGCGWPKGKGGVGWARKLCMDKISEMAQPHDVVVSIDADTHYPSEYLSEINRSLSENPKAAGLAIPYFHPLAGDETDLLILRYEIYMRHYALQMLRINNPYAFSALGSAMAFPVWAYRKAGGMTPVKSGEDFYFMQKLVKLGRLMLWCDTVAYPSSRFSDRVVFGTGPALTKGNTGDWTSYPIYHPDFFDEVQLTFDAFNRLFLCDEYTPMDDFLFSKFNTPEVWSPLRKNFKREELFVRACIEKLDGLRILQFLRERQSAAQHLDEFVFVESYKHEWPQLFSPLLVKQIKERGVLGMEISHLEAYREALFIKENSLRREKYFNSL